jgi:hypothetical protein
MNRPMDAVLLKLLVALVLIVAAISAVGKLDLMHPNQAFATGEVAR